MTMVGGDYYKILASLFPSGLLGLMAKYKDVNVKKPGHFIK